MDRHSFQLVQHTTSLTTEQFYQPDIIKEVVFLGDQTFIVSLCLSIQVYYREISKILKAVTGARAVQIFHHQIRNPERNNGSSSNVNTSIQGYASRIHLDTEPFGCQETFKHYLSETQEPELRQGRFVVMNAWRNISDIPIQRDHLALLDETSTVKPDDYITGDFFGNVRSFIIA